MQDPPLSVVVGRRLRDLRVAAGLSVEVLARQTGVSRRELLRIEGGAARPSVEVLHRVAKPLKASLIELVRGASKHETMRPTEPLPVRLARIASAIAELPAEVGSKLDAVEEAVVRHAMMVCGGNKSAAARLIGIERKALERRWLRVRKTVRTGTPKSRNLSQ